MNDSGKSSGQMKRLGCLWKSDQIAGRHCSKMDLGKDKSHVKYRQTSDPHQEENHTPEVTGRWRLRNREQLRKRTAESQGNQTSQWHFGEQKKRKLQRTGKGNQRGRKRQQNTELKVEPQSQIEKEVMEQALAPTEKETELPGSVSEALPSVASPQKVVPKQHFSETHQESIINQENSSEYQEVVVQNHSSETCEQMAEPENHTPKMCQEIAIHEDHTLKMCQDTAKPEGLTPKMSQEITVLQDHSLEMGQDAAKPEDHTPKMSQEITVLQDHSLKMCQDTAIPEDYTPKMCQETAVPKALPCTTSDAISDLEGCSPEAYPKADVPTTPDMYQNPGELEQYNAESVQETAENEDFFPKTQEIAVPKDLSTKTYPETVESEYSSHETYKEITVPAAPSHKTIQETPQPEEYSPETYQETPGPGKYSPKIYQETSGLQVCSPEINQETLGPENLSTKMYENKVVPKECFPEPYQEISGPQGQDPKVHQKDANDVYSFPQDMKEKPKAEEPATLNIPQEISPENDVYSYVLF
ncbi:hemogen isoform X2 [Microcebus murinus]|uniref:hemogen isoform X2 n=1 Tax=Microcebus murinus TaxID=30608 RepID=UPI003F6B371C